jgi:hypothetical protein
VRGFWGAGQDRKGEHPRAHLSSFTGTLQADGYAGFEQIYEAGRIQEAACWAHVRRKFYDLVAAHKSPVATEALERIGALYAIEKEIRGRSPEERREVRNERARPLLESLQQWLEGQVAPQQKTKAQNPAIFWCAFEIGGSHGCDQTKTPPWVAFLWARISSVCATRPMIVESGAPSHRTYSQKRLFAGSSRVSWKYFASPSFVSRIVVPVITPLVNAIAHI